MGNFQKVGAGGTAIYAVGEINVTLTRLLCSDSNPIGQGFGWLYFQFSSIIILKQIAGSRVEA
jgi:hypothetical protein